MVFTAVVRATIETCFKAKGWLARRLCLDEEVERRVSSVYEGRRQPLATLDALQERIEAVLDEVVVDGAILRKAVVQFRPRLKAIVAQHRHSITKYFA